MRGASSRNSLEGPNTPLFSALSQQIPSRSQQVTNGAHKAGDRPLVHEARQQGGVRPMEGPKTWERKYLWPFTTG